MPQTEFALFDISGFMPHGHCYLWTPALLWQYQISDGLIGLSYYSIPLALMYYVRRRRDFGFNWIVVLFSAFIFACGTTHFLGVWTTWHPDYWLDASVKTLTAVLSVITAIALIPLIPRAIKLPSPAELRDVVNRLESEVRERAEAQASLRLLNDTLESRVAERTAELRAANQRLHDEIASRAEADEALRLSEKRLSSLVMSISETFWVTDSQGTPTHRQAVSANPANNYVYDTNREPWSHPVHPEDQAPNIAKWNAGMADKKPFSGQYRLQGVNGEWLHMEFAAVPIFDGNGAISEWIGITRDITQQHAADSKIALLNMRIRELIEVVTTLAAAREFNVVVNAVTAAARRLVTADGAAFVLHEGNKVRYIEEEAIGPLFKGQAYDVDTCISGWAVTHHAVAVVEDIHTDPRVDARYYEGTFVKSLTVLPIRTADPLGAIGVYWASPRKLEEDELQLLKVLADACAIAVENLRHYESLEAEVSERTAQLQAANRELQTFTYSVSHDLKAPLRGIDGYSRLLLEDHGGDLNDEGRAFLANIRKGAQQMGQLIEDLLNYSRLERRGLHTQTLELTPFIEHLVAQFSDEVSKKNAKLLFKFTPGPIVADPDGLAMALRNLIDNALKFSRSNIDPVIEIGGKRQENTYVLSVRDNGIGFDMKYRDRVFDIFQRLHRIEEFPGTGIGLAIVRKAMQRMNGNSWVESSPGKGSTFYLELPQ